MVQDICMENKVSICGVPHSLIKDDFLMPETQQTIIVIILIILSQFVIKPATHSG